MNLGRTLNTAAEESAPAISDDGLSLYFNRNPNLPGDSDPVLVRELSSPSGDARPAIRTDDLDLVFHSDRPAPPLTCPADSPIPSGGQDLWVSTRATEAEAWSCPVNLGSVVNSASNDLQAALSDDAEVLFFSSNRPGGSGSDDLWMSMREKGS